MEQRKHFVTSCGKVWGTVISCGLQQCFSSNPSIYSGAGQLSSSKYLGVDVDTKASDRVGPSTLNCSERLLDAVKHNVHMLLPIVQAEPIQLL